MKTELALAAEDVAVSRAAEILRGGGLVAIPTETVYGLGANAFDATAVARIFEAKQRPAFDPLIVHVGSLDAVAAVVSDAPAIARTLAEAFWPGPLTMVLPKAAAIPEIVTSGLDTVAVRVPSHPVAQRLLTLVEAIAAPSANPFGQLSPTNAQHVRDALSGSIEMILDGGPTDWGVESTIVDLTHRIPRILRPGAVTREQLQSAIGEVEVHRSSSSAPKAPGQLSSHYSPRTELRVVEGDWSQVKADDAVLAFRDPPAGEFRATAVLAPDGDLRQAASSLFETLHRLDASGASVIHAELAPAIGLGVAINDRLRRAAHS